MDPAHGPPLQARVAAANGTVLQLANMLYLILAHMDMNGGEQSKNEMNGGKNVEKGSGHGEGKMAGRQTKPAEQGTAGGHSQRILRPAQASNKQPAVGRPCSKNNSCQMVLACPSPCSAGKWGSAVVLAARKAGSDLPKPVSTPPNAFACHCPYPLP